MKVLIGGIEYIPKAEIPEPTDGRIKDCLETLTEMIYFKQNHKMQGLAMNAIKALSEDIYKLACDNPTAAYEAIHGVEDDD